MWKRKTIRICYLDSANLGRGVRTAVEELNRDYDNFLHLDILAFSEVENPATRTKALDTIASARLVMADLRGSSPLVKEVVAATRRGRSAAVALIGGEPTVMSITKLGLFDGNRFFNGPRGAKMAPPGGHVDGDFDFDEIDRMLKKKLPGFIYRDIGNWFEVTRYWQNGGVENIKRMITLLCRTYCRARFLPKPEPHIAVPSPGIRHPELDRVYGSLPEYLQDYRREDLVTHPYDPHKPTVVVVFYDGMHYEASVVPTFHLVKVLQDRANMVPISCDGIKNLAALEKLSVLDGQFIGDAILHMTHFRLNGGPLGGKTERTVELLKRFGVPVYHPVSLFGSTLSEWQESAQGLLPIDYMSHVTLPELDGSVEPILVCGRQEGTHPATAPIEPVEERISHYADRVLRRIELRRMDNRDKKIGLVIYNYPPGEHNLANAAYLDTFRSVSNILVTLRDKGYTVGDIPADIGDYFVQENLVNSPRWSHTPNGVVISRSRYQELTSDLPQLQSDIDEAHGPFPGPVNACAEGVVLPVTWFGNVCVALQPPRGTGNPEQSYHDKLLPPHHQYLAFYLWMQEQVDALVHIGTHGTLEFLRGKEVAISRSCDMDRLVGSLPHFYVYQTGNPSEAMIAKRRSLATLIGYDTPPADSAGLYGEFLTLADLFDEREQAHLSDPQRIPLIEQQIRELSEKFQWGDLEGNLSRIRRRLIDLRRALIPVGLRTLGEVYTEDEKDVLLRSMLRLDHGECPSLNRVLAQERGYDYDELLAQSSPVLEELDEAAAQVVSGWLRGEGDSSYRAQQEFAEDVLARLETDEELPALITALGGGYLAPGLAGDVLRNPEVLPAGRNLYQFDPLSLPTASAVERGRIIALNTLRAMRDENGAYPRTAGVILWGFETAKTAGETIGQIFEYLGVRMKSRPGSWHPEVELIAREELSHPRVDTVIQVCGFFRDMFPNLVNLLDDAVALVADSPEPDNAVAAASEEIFAQLRASGMSHPQAQALSTVRMFGPKPSEYGTSLTEVVETSGWEREEQLGEYYQRDMRFCYGREFHGEDAGALSELLLSRVELVSQVQDTYQYEVTDLDHYYEFFGGFAKAVENNRGEKPRMLTTNTSTEVIRTEDVETAILRGVSSRTLNPKWIDSMLEHRHHGAQTIADRMHYLVGLSATTGAVSSQTWQETADTLVFDSQMRQRLQENNPHAAHEIARRLFEALRRGYWQASKEQEQELRELLLSMEEDLEG